MAISRWLRPSSYFRRNSSRIFRMDNLFCDTLFLVSGDLGEDGRGRIGTVHHITEVSRTLRSLHGP